MITLFAGNTKDSAAGPLWGIVALLLSQVCGSLFLVSSRRSSREFSSIEITFFTTLVGAVAFNSVNLVRHLTDGTVSRYFVPLLNWENLVGFLFLGILSSIVATIMNNYALSRLQASSVSALNGISTLTSIALGVLVRHEVLHWYHLVGAAMILVGGIGVNRIAQSRTSKPSE